MRFTRPFIAIGCMLAVGLPAAEFRKPAAAAEQGREPSVEDLVDRLSDDRFKVREEATRKIWELGEPAMPALREAAKSKDPERAYRARELVRKIELHITPSTDPVVIAMVERYSKANATEKEKVALMAQMRQRRAWRQILKLFAAEKKPEIRAALQGSVDGVAVVAARERLMADDADGAREFLEMAPVTPDSLVALAAFHRSQGTLEAELERASTLKGINADAWKLALHRAAGNSTAAREAAEATGDKQMAAAMAVLAGDPIPWLRQNGVGEVTTGPHDRYPDLAIRRWQGGKVVAADLDPFRRQLDRDDDNERWKASASLILLGETDEAEKRHAKDSPLNAFLHFDLMERIPEALRTLGLDPVKPDYNAWVAERIDRLSEEPEDEGSHFEDVGNLLILANFMERRGLHEEAYAAFGPPLKEMAANDRHRFSDFLGGLFNGRRVRSNAPTLALRIGAEWAGEKDDHWEDLVSEAFSDEEMIGEWWKWLQTLQPDRTRRERMAGLLALFNLGADPENLRQKWMDRVWEFVEGTPDEERAPYLARILYLTSHAPDAASSLKASDLSGRKDQEEIYGNQQLFNLVAEERWDEAAAIYQRIIASSANVAASNPHFHASVAAFLRQAGKHEEAAVHDAWVEKLALGDAGANLNIANAYNLGRDYEREALWHSRAAHECDPESSIFTRNDPDAPPGALKSHADSLLKRREWAAAASAAEALAMMGARSDNIGVASPGFLMNLRFQADFTRAMAMLENDRKAAVALLARCHRTFARDGTLADHFFPSLREAGLVKEHDEWFEMSWKLVTDTIARFPASDNTLNTASWLASRAVRRLDETKELQREALRLRPNQAAYLDTMAEIEFARGNRDEAIRWAKLSVNFAPHDAMVRQQYDRFLNAPLPR